MPGVIQRIEKIVQQFFAKKHINHLQPWGSGHINDTYLVGFDKDPQRYLLQRVNHFVFRDVPGLIENMLKVIRHINDVSSSYNNAWKKLYLIPTASGRYYYKDNDGNYWRVINFIENSISLDVVINKEQAYQCGLAFGLFSAFTKDLPPENFIETIPDFHNVSKRLINFNNIIKEDPVDRLSEVNKEVDFLLKRSDEMQTINKMGEKGVIPLRVTHNDTKLNNVLLDKDSYRPIGVVDLDTVMPGFIHYDFGDAVRTIISTAAEDEKNLAKVNINIDLFETFATGYKQHTQSFLTNNEKTFLAFSSKLMTYIMALRFLTDYLEGDVYYKTQYKIHNLVRARNQMSLLLKMEHHFLSMKKIIRSIFNFSIL